MLMEAESLEVFQYIVESKYFHSRELSPTHSRMLQLENYAIPLEIRQVYHQSACIPVSSSHLVSAVTKTRFGERFYRTNLRYCELAVGHNFNEIFERHQSAAESKYFCRKSFPTLPIGLRLYRKSSTSSGVLQ